MGDNEKTRDVTKIENSTTSATQADVAPPGIADSVKHPYAGDRSSEIPFFNPRCLGMQELPNAAQERARVASTLAGQIKVTSSDRQTCSHEPDSAGQDDPLFIHLSQGLAYTIGSALGTRAPSVETCLAAFLVANNNGLTAGSRAWSKHAHRSQHPPSPASPSSEQLGKGRRTKHSTPSAGWWGTASGPVGAINEKSLALFWKVMNRASWRNLHWLPHKVLVYEVRVPEGYGMRWSQDQGDRGGKGDEGDCKEDRLWIFRGFLEPSMEDGHEVRWRHPVAPPH